MKAPSKYISRKPDKNGFVDYPQDEHDIWKLLSQRQLEIIKGRACQEYMEGLDIIKLPIDTIPQIPEVNKKLNKATGWAIEPVPALIGFNRFFKLLANRKFPCATFIRTQEELEYLPEPDIFHEIFGHCPMLTNQVFADFTQKYGELGLNQSPTIQKLLARFYWFTAEFGLIKTPQGLRCYGGVLSSIGETVYALESPKPKREPFNALNMLRTPYRIDTFQPIYYYIDSYEQIYQVVNKNFIGLIHQAKSLGEFEPLF